MSLKLFALPDSRSPVLVAYVCVLVLASRPVSAQSADDLAARARRIAAVATIAGQEYGRGVASGTLISATEVNEARALLADAGRLTDSLPPTARRAVRARLDSVDGKMVALADPVTVRSAVAGLYASLARTLGIDLAPVSPVPPALARGALVYSERCAACHGASGAGDGPAGRGLNPPPADLTHRAPTLSPLDVFLRVNVGVPGTAMAGYESSLSLEDRWAISAYVSGLRYTDAERRDGEQWFQTVCPDCLPWATDWEALARVSDDSLASALASLSGRSPGAAAVAFARTAGAADVLGADRALAVRRTAARVETLLDSARVRASAGDKQAAQAAALDAYLAFEEIESDVGARSERRVMGAERSFTELRAALAGGSAVEINRSDLAARHALAGVVGLFERDGTPTVLFAQSLVIVLREGVEALLILAALSAFLVKAGAADRRRELSWGIAAGVVASLATAALFAAVTQVSHAGQEAIEGLTLLLASAVLFGMTSWIVSKVEAERWQAFVRSQMEAALGSRGALAIAGVAFLAVYREGVETVLFYAALTGTAHDAAGMGAVIAGLGVGTLALVGLYLSMQRWGVRIPLRPFFAVTGMLLTVMSVSFAGQGVAELQGIGWVPATPVRLPALPALGVFPTVQTLGIQAVVGLTFVAAVSWILWGPRRSQSSVS
jgi:high-affinity iron transporter